MKFTKSGIRKNESKERELRTLPGPGQYQTLERGNEKKQKSYKFGNSKRETNLSKDGLGPSFYKFSES